MGQDAGACSIKKLAVGIDPGKTGAVCFLDAITRQVVALHDCPVLKAGKRHDFDTSGMVAVLREVDTFLDPDQGACMVVLERSMSRPSQGRESIRITGLGEGVWRGIVSALGYPFSLVHCSTWQNFCYKGQGLKGTTKERSIQRAKMLFPGLDLVPIGCRKPSHDRAESALIAWYACSLI